MLLIENTNKVKQMGTSSISKINRLVDTLLSDEIELIRNKDLMFLLIYLDTNTKNTLKVLDEIAQKRDIDLHQCLDTLITNKLIKKDDSELFCISEKGKQFLTPIYSATYKLQQIPKDAISGYAIEDIMPEGSTSVTFKAVKVKTGKPVVLKVIKPGILDHVDISQRVKDVSALRDDYLVVPDDYGEFSYQDIKLKYFEMDYVEGKTLRDFLKDKIHFEVESFLIHYIKEVGGVLSKIQTKGLQHGDLHLNNIMVTEDTVHKSKYHFKIIDFIGLDTKKQFKEYEYSDIEFFCKNFKSIVSHVIYLSGESTRRALGERLSQIYTKTLEDKYTSIDQIINDLSVEYHAPEIKKYKIAEPFTKFVFEQYDINDPQWLRVFEPDTAFYNTLSSFNNVIVSGPRGCGKTIYMKSLCFVPDLIEKIFKKETLKPLRKKYINYKEIFGIFFPCRQAEFKIFSNKYFEFTPKTELFIKHVYILKIIRKTLSLIGRGYEKNIIKGAFVYENILNFLIKYLRKHFGLIGDVNELSEISLILDDEETECVNLLGLEDQYPQYGKLLNENELIEFFDIINKSIPELQNTKFYIIFDDVSDPNMSFEAQKILNSIARTNNSKFCFKISTERYGYEFVDTEGKILESPHDYTFVDLSGFGKDNKDGYNERMKKYLEKVVNTQLKVNGYNREISEYLEALPYTHDELIKLLSERAKGNTEKNNKCKELDKKIKYAGWDIIYQISSGSVRVALQICDSIFKEFGEENQKRLMNDNSLKIDVNTQHLAVSKFSREEYGNLINIKDVGKQIFDIVRNFGFISRSYLTRKITKQEDRRFEMICVERTDNDELNPLAKEMLRTLVRYSIFTDVGLSFSLSQIGLIHKFTLHKRFSPALKVTFREREHMRLSKRRLELLLQEPDKFSVEGTEFLQTMNVDKSQLKLFENNNG